MTDKFCTPTLCSRVGIKWIVEVKKLEDGIVGKNFEIAEAKKIGEIFKLLSDNMTNKNLIPLKEDSSYGVNQDIIDYFSTRNVINKLNFIHGSRLYYRPERIKEYRMAKEKVRAMKKTYQRIVEIDSNTIRPNKTMCDALLEAFHEVLIGSLDFKEYARLSSDAQFAFDFGLRGYTGGASNWHYHNCNSCGVEYMHNHATRDSKTGRNMYHKQRNNQCVNPSCSWYQGANPTGVVSYTMSDYHNLPSNAAYPDEECIICLTNMTLPVDNAIKAVVRTCCYSEDDVRNRYMVSEHYFHASCLSQYLANNTKCPVCRATIYPTSIEALIEKRDITYPVQEIPRPVEQPQAQIVNIRRDRYGLEVQDVVRANLYPLAPNSAFRNGKLNKLYANEYNHNYANQAWKTIYEALPMFATYDEQLKRYLPDLRNTVIRPTTTHEHPFLATLRKTSEFLAIEDSGFEVTSNGEGVRVDATILSIGGNPYRLSTMARDVIVTKPLITQNDVTRSQNRRPDNAYICDCAATEGAPICAHILTKAFTLEHVVVRGNGACGYEAIAKSNSHKLKEIRGEEIRTEVKEYKESKWLRIFAAYTGRNILQAYEYLLKCRFLNNKSAPEDYLNTANWYLEIGDWFIEGEYSWLNRYNDMVTKEEKISYMMLSKEDGLLFFIPNYESCVKDEITLPDRIVYHSGNHFEIAIFRPRNDVLVLNTDVEYYPGTKFAANYLSRYFRTYTINHMIVNKDITYKIIEATINVRESNCQMIVNGNITYNHPILNYNIDRDNDKIKEIDYYVYRKSIKSFQLAEHQHYYNIYRVFANQNDLIVESSNKSEWLTKYGSVELNSQNGLLKYDNDSVYFFERGYIAEDRAPASKVGRYDKIKACMPHFMRPTRDNNIVNISNNLMKNDETLTIDEVTLAAILAAININKVVAAVNMDDNYIEANNVLNNGIQVINTYGDFLNKVKKINDHEFKRTLIMKQDDNILTYTARYIKNTLEYYGSEIGHLVIGIFSTYLCYKNLGWKSATYISGAILSGTYLINQLVLGSKVYKPLTFSNHLNCLSYTFFLSGTTMYLGFNASIALVYGFGLYTTLCAMAARTDKRILIGGSFQTYGSKNKPGVGVYNKLLKLGSQIKYDKDNKLDSMVVRSNKSNIPVEDGFVEYEKLDEIFTKDEDRKRDITQIAPILIPDTYPTAYAATSKNLYTATMRFYSKVPKADPGRLAHYNLWVNTIYREQIRNKLRRQEKYSDRTFTDWLNNQKVQVKKDLIELLANQGIIKDSNTIQNMVKTDELNVDYETEARPRLIMAPTNQSKYLGRFKWDCMKIMNEVDFGSFSGLNWEEMSKKILLMNLSHKSNENYGDGDSSMFETTQLLQQKTILITMIYEELFGYLGDDFYQDWKTIEDRFALKTTHMNIFKDKLFPLILTVLGKTNSGDSGTTFENTQLNLSYLRYWCYALDIKETDYIKMAGEWTILKEGQVSFGAVGDDYLLKTEKHLEEKFTQNMNLIYTTQDQDGGLGQVYKGKLIFTRYPDFLSVDLITRLDNSVRIVRKINRWAYTIPWSQSINHCIKYDKIISNIEEMAWAIGKGMGWAENIPIMWEYAKLLIRTGRPMSKNDYKKYLAKQKYSDEPRILYNPKPEDRDLYIDLLQEKYHIDRHIIELIELELRDLKKLNQKLEYNLRDYFNLRNDYDYTTIEEIHNDSGKVIYISKH